MRTSHKVAGVPCALATFPTSDPQGCGECRKNEWNIRDPVGQMWRVSVLQEQMRTSYTEVAGFRIAGANADSLKTDLFRSFAKTVSNFTSFYIQTDYYL